MGFYSPQLDYFSKRLEDHLGNGKADTDVVYLLKCCYTFGT
jgi:hypothetical protein